METFVVVYSLFVNTYRSEYRHLHVFGFAEVELNICEWLHLLEWAGQLEHGLIPGPHSKQPHQRAFNRASMLIALKCTSTPVSVPCETDGVVRVDQLRLPTSQIFCRMHAWRLEVLVDLLGVVIEFVLLEFGHFFIHFCDGLDVIWMKFTEIFQTSDFVLFLKYCIRGKINCMTENCNL